MTSVSSKRTSEIKSEQEDEAARLCSEVVLRHQSTTPTCSAGGSRLLRQWLCRPLRHIPDINARLDAVEEISNRAGLVGPLRGLLKGMPDLERALGRARNSTAPPVEGLPEWAVKSAQNRSHMQHNALILHLHVQSVASSIGISGQQSKPQNANSAVRLRSL